MFSGIPVAKEMDENEPQRPRFYAGRCAAYWYSARIFIFSGHVQHDPSRQRFHPFPLPIHSQRQNSDAISRLLEMTRVLEAAGRGLLPAWTISPP